MGRQTTRLLKAALAALHYSGSAKFAARNSRKCGVVLMLHHVTPEAPRGFEPNGILKVTPDFLEAVIGTVRGEGFEIIGLDDVKARIENGASRERPFAVFTLDDGYKDNRDFAYPVFKRHNVPFTVFVPTAYADGEGDLWWLVLEEALRRLADVKIERDGALKIYVLGNDAEKTKAFEEIYWWLRQMPEARARAITRDLASQAGFDPLALCRKLVMNWDEIRALAQDPLVTIAAHTCNHFALAKLPSAEATREIAESVKRVSEELGKPCRHFSYPYGDEESAGEREFEIARSLGIETAVTTRKGLIDQSHASAMTALPRLSLNGDYQDQRFVSVLLSGLPFALRDRAKSALSPLRSRGAGEVMRQDVASRR
ncbi:polysaccharide deacetylase family protein [Hyphomicrobium sp. 99]|uniref:polysaccharide deacetylase family protein n=1 Tax=Hyphomicrobium sp. 99 TaxID=1163419 RepID=UPI0005F804B0|nr:polysaccharide deacetylase family protein [Hyphomicrobium sp. 99]